VISKVKEAVVLIFKFYIDKLEEIEEKEDIKIFRELFIKQRREKDIHNIKEVYILKDEYVLSVFKKAYPLIFEIENLMRELILKIMTFMAKKDWVKMKSLTDIS